MDSKQIAILSAVSIVVLLCSLFVLMIFKNSHILDVGESALDPSLPAFKSHEAYNIPRQRHTTSRNLLHIMERLQTLQQQQQDGEANELVFVSEFPYDWVDAKDKREEVEALVQTLVELKEKGELDLDSMQRLLEGFYSAGERGQEAFVEGLTDTDRMVLGTLLATDTEGGYLLARVFFPDVPSRLVAYNAFASSVDESMTHFFSNEDFHEETPIGFANIYIHDVREMIALHTILRESQAIREKGLNPVFFMGFGRAHEFEKLQALFGKAANGPVQVFGANGELLSPESYYQRDVEFLSQTLRYMEVFLNNDANMWTAFMFHKWGKQIRELFDNGHTDFEKMKSDNWDAMMQNEDLQSELVEFVKASKKDYANLRQDLEKAGLV